MADDVQANGHDQEAETSPPELATETLSGDIRDAILTEFKQMAKPWATMAEHEQERMIWRARSIAEQVVRGSVDLVAKRGLAALPVEVGKITLDGSSCKGTYECYVTDETLLQIRHLQGQRAMFVLASPDAYHGERKAADTDNVGELAIPKTGPGAPSDPEALAKVGRGKKRGRPPKGDQPPAAEHTPADTSDPPFAVPPDAPAEPMPEAPQPPTEQPAQA